MEKRFRRILKLFNKIFNEDKEVMLNVSNKMVDSVGGLTTVINGVYHVLIYKNSIAFRIFNNNRAKRIMAENTILSHEISHVYCTDIEVFYDLTPTEAILWNSLEDFRVDYITDIMVMKGHRIRMMTILYNIYTLIEMVGSQNIILNEDMLNLVTIPTYLNNYIMFGKYPNDRIRDILDHYKVEIFNNPFNKDIVMKYIKILKDFTPEISHSEYMSMMFS
ncbi:MAG: hypothetical protein QXD03_01685 [Candidatus Anstonellales archaeon]